MRSGHDVRGYHECSRIATSPHDRQQSRSPGSDELNGMGKAFEASRHQQSDDVGEAGAGGVAGEGYPKRLGYGHHLDANVWAKSVQ